MWLLHAAVIQKVGFAMPSPRVSGETIMRSLCVCGVEHAIIYRLVEDSLTLNTISRVVKHKKRCDRDLSLKWLEQQKHKK